MKPEMFLKQLNTEKAEIREYVTKYTDEDTFEKAMRMARQYQERYYVGEHDEAVLATIKNMLQRFLNSCNNEKYPDTFNSAYLVELILEFSYLCILEDYTDAETMDMDNECNEIVKNAERNKEITYFVYGNEAIKITTYCEVVHEKNERVDYYYKEYGNIYMEEIKDVAEINKILAK